MMRSHTPTATRPTRRQRWRAALLAATLCLGAGAADAACQPADYCNQAGNCLSLAQIESQVETVYGAEGYKVTQVRLRGHAPSQTCLWFEVQMTHASRGQKVVYWNITGGEAQ